MYQSSNVIILIAQNFSNRSEYKILRKMQVIKEEQHQYLKNK